MSWLRDTIAGRTIIVLVLGLGSILAIAQFLYQSVIESELSARNADAVVERLLVLADTVTSVETDKRDAAAHRLSGGPLELHWGQEPLAIAGGDLDQTVLLLRDRLVARSPALRDGHLIIGTSRPDASAQASKRSKDTDYASHTTLLSLPLSDGSWLNVNLARVQTARATSPSVLLSALLGAIGVVLVSILMSRWLTQPLDRLAAGARRLFITSNNEPLPETGTREVRTLAAAINDLQQRIGKLVNERTEMLAAVSHDLRTPLTRLRLRVAGVESDAVRSNIEADLDEMEDMINATLAFLRDDLTKELVEQVDVIAILETIAADATDAGQKVEIHGPRHLVMAGRHLALKRALTNLVQNAVKYGSAAVVTTALGDGHIRISIEDEGPGIPPDQLEAMFEPFIRGERSRGKSTGGYGLGLAVARSILRSHGGDVALRNRNPRGLEARVTLPMSSE